MNYLSAFLGICLVIFVHELGHFLAARLCGVRVETFSIGMGPRLFSWTRGATRYQLAAFPLGGYVKMAGEELADGTGEDTPRKPRPDELGGKTVGQRFLIFSGGVIMNVIFGLIVFPIVFLVGIPFEAPVVGSTAPGSPAWEAGMQPGTTILEIEGAEIRTFSDIMTAVALGPPGPLDLLVQDPGATEPRHMQIDAAYQADIGLRLLGVGQAYDENMKLNIAPDSSAAQAGILTGDFLRAVEGAPPGYSLFNALIFAQNSQLSPRLQVETPDVSDSLRWVTLKRPSPGPEVNPTIGITPMMRHVVAVRGAALAMGFQVDDRVLAINDTPVRDEGDVARLVTDALAANEAVRFAIQRDDARVTLDSSKVPNLDMMALLDDVVVAGDIETAVVRVVQDSPAYRAGLRTEDRIVRIKGDAVESWADVAASIRNLAQQSPDQPIQLDVFHQSAPGEPIETPSFAVIPAPSPYDTPLGINVYPRKVLVQADSLPEAIIAGTQSTWHFLAESWVFLKRVVSQDIAASNAGGIITIGAVSSHWATEGLAKLFFFLALLSMNLAFLNILPVPLLDGGHLFFLLIEKLKGSPVSPRIQIMSQGVGMVLLLSLMVFVTVNDVMRWLIN